MTGEFTANYIFAKNNLVVLRHPKGKFLTVSPNQSPKIDENGGTGEYARCNIDYHEDGLN